MFVVDDEVWRVLWGMMVEGMFGVDECVIVDDYYVFVCEMKE